MPKPLEDTKLLDAPERTKELPNYDPVKLTAGNIEKGRKQQGNTRQEAIISEFANQKDEVLPEPDFANMAQESENVRQDAIEHGLREAGLAAPEVDGTTSGTAGRAAVRNTVELPQPVEESPELVRH